jgi:RecB family endonuclease NucS
MTLLNDDGTSFKLQDQKAEPQNWDTGNSRCSIEKNLQYDDK